MPFGFGPFGGGGGAGHPTPRRRRQQAVEAPREVLVFIDERRRPRHRRRHDVADADGTSREISAVDADADVGDVTAGAGGGGAGAVGDGSIFTPKIRNRSAATGGGGLGEFLALPDLKQRENGDDDTSTAASPSDINHSHSSSQFMINPRVSTLSESPSDHQQQQQQKSSLHHRIHKGRQQSARRRSTSFGSVGGLSLGSSTVHTLSDDEDAHESGTLDGYRDGEDGADDDDASVHSLLREEVFQNAVLKVSFVGGIVTLEYPPEEEDEMEHAEVVPAAAPAMEIRNASTQLQEMEEKRANAKAYGSVDTDNDYSDDDGVLEGNALPPLPRDKPIPHHFELQSTNIHSLEDEEMRKKNEIRLAVLEASLKTYKDADAEIPEVLLAQINECRQASSLQPKGAGGIVEAVISAVATASAAPSRRNSTLSPTSMVSTSISESRDPQVSVEPPYTPIVASRASSFYGDPNSRTPSFRGEDVAATPLLAPAESVPTTNKGRTRKVRISKDDEIHVLPCQCAFKLVGMQGLNILGPTLENKAMDQPQLASNSLHGSHMASVLQTPIQRRPSLPVSLQQSAPAHLGRTTLAVSTPVRSNLAGAQPSDDLSILGGMTMAKTPSAQAARSKMPASIPSTPCSPTSSTNGGFIHHPASPEDGSAPLHLGGPPGEKPNKRNSNRLEQSTFQSMGYHEITLMRKGSTGNRDSESEGEEFVDWDALTIRCRDHDELDAIISSLKTSARAHVVPFSPDPRAKLKKKKQEEARKILKKRRRRRSSSVGRLRSNTSGASLEGIDVHRTPHDEKERPSMTSPLTPPSSERRQSQKSPLSKRKTRQEQSKTFNKEDYCECCGFQFTLLTRRHHCRKCDRSCCGDCSTLIIVKGGEEKRFCNRCSVLVINKQSKNLHRRISGLGQSSNAVLPGKVHDDCGRLGVGVIGKLPHWKNYIAWDRDRRPAVGRITIELLEALALPSIDVSGKSDPYVRATITGYDKDMRWNLKEWSTIFSLSTPYRLGTLAPVWRGSGRKGGELLTLPVISTAGAVLRLEVLHFDPMTHARGKDAVLGIVEIPLSDFPNANLRKAEAGGDVQKRKKKDVYDGYADRWYRLRLPEAGMRSDEIILSKPIPDPMQEKRRERDGDDDSATEGIDDKKNRNNVVVHSLQEIGERIQRISTAPVEWIGTALRIDVPRRPEAGAQRRARAAIHVRVKLNANEVGDMLSHTWFPPVEPYPPMPKYDPQILFRNALHVSKKLSPYQKRWKFVEDCIKWRHPPKVCVFAYAVLALHLALFPYFLFELHVYLYIFLWTRLRQMKDRPHTLERVDSFDASLFDTENSKSQDETEDGDKVPSRKDDDNKQVSKKKKGDKAAMSKVNESPSLTELSNHNKVEGGNKRGAQEVGDENKVPTDNDGPSSKKDSEEDVAKLNKAVEWIAKRAGQDRGLETLQFKLGMLGKDLTKLNSIWDGSSVLKTRIAMVVLIISFALHFRVNHRILWIAGSAIWFFGAMCPGSKRAGRSFVGVFSGIAKIIRRRQLHDIATREVQKRDSS